jgi:hypothetical protein
MNDLLRKPNVNLMPKHLYLCNVLHEYSHFTKCLSKLFTGGDERGFFVGLILIKNKLRSY